jgi:uncharacterized protein
MMNSDLEPRNTGGEIPPPSPSPEKCTILEAVFLGPQEIRAGWRAGLYVAIFLLLATALQAIVALLRIAVRRQIGSGLFLQEVLLVACALAAAQVMAFLEGRRVGDYGLPWRSAFRGHFWQGVFWGIAEITVLMLLIRALGGYSFGGLALRGTEAAHYALLWAGFFLVVGFAEEFLFRGYLQFTLASGMGFWPAAILLSVAFGAVHLRNPGEGPAGALGVFVIAMFFCFTLRRTGDLWFAIGIHAAYDFGETYLYSVPNSGIMLQGHLLAASLHGPHWLTGGSIGPEGSVLAFAVLAVMFVVFDRVYRPRSPRAN